MRCPDCGIANRLNTIDREYNENGWEIEVVYTYECECGCKFTGTFIYECQDPSGIIEKLPKSFS